MALTIAYIAFLVIVLLIILWFSAFFFISELIWLIRTKWVPYVWSFKSDLNLMKQNLKLEKNKTLLDLWCGDGRALRFFINHFELDKWTGYEINNFAVFWGKLLNKILNIKNIDIIKSNFKNAELSKYDYIYIYLFPKTMAEIESWVFENINENTIIISNTFQFAEKKPFETFRNEKWKEKIFLYKKD